METRKKHLAYANLNQFDPFLRDGASWDILARLQYFQRLGLRASILSFPLANSPGKHLTAEMAEGGRLSFEAEGQTTRALFRGVNYLQEFVSGDIGYPSDYHRPTVKRLYSAIRRAEVDYLITADEGYLPLLAGWLLSLPGSHWFFSLDNVRRFAREAEYGRYLKNRTVLTCSQYLQSEIKARLGLEAVLWYPSLDFSRYRVEHRPPGTGRIGFCAKGQKQANEVVSEVARRLPERSVIVVGQAFDPGQPLPGNIALWGHAPDMKKFYEQIDLLLVPSAEDSFPRVILEAQANGIPVIANRLGGIPEAMAEGGILIDIQPGEDGTFDSLSLADKYVPEVRRLLDDQNLYATFSQRALARAARYEAGQGKMAEEIYQACILPFLSSAKRE